MIESLIIKSVRGPSSLKLSEAAPASLGCAPEYFRATIRGHGVAESASRIYVYDPRDLADFFNELAANHQGWEGTKTWSSVEGDLSFESACDVLGHVLFNVTLKSGPYNDDWSVRVAIYVDLGQLPDIAAQVRHFLQVS